MMFLLFFFFNDTATTEIYTLSLHDALPISADVLRLRLQIVDGHETGFRALPADRQQVRSEEHTSELQSPYDLVCRLLLEKKKKNKRKLISNINKISLNESLQNTM